MQSFINLNKRTFGSLLLIAGLLAYSVLLATSQFTKIGAAQITERQITIATSEVSATGVNYDVSFIPTQTTAIEGIVVDFCQDSPLIGQACDKTNGVTSVPTTGTITVSQTGATPASENFDAVAGTTPAAGRLLLTHTTGFTAVSTTNPITFTVTVDNPTGTASTVGDPGTYYGRILTYTDDTVATDYTSTTPGTHLDDGGVAMSTAHQLTVNARVQEELEFCVGVVDSTVTSDGTAPANCSAGAFSGSTPTVDLGVVSSSSPSISPIDTANNGNDNNGAVMIRTNAVNGATVTYFAEQETSSGRLKVIGATCSGSTGTFDAGSSTQDQCFNSNNDQDDAGNDFSTSGEKFGMTISNVFRPTGSTTTNLTRDANYDGDGTAAGGFAWEQDGTVTSIASSSTVLDYEMLLLRFAARTAATTPTGFYSNTSTYVATSTF